MNKEQFINEVKKLNIEINNDIMEKLDLYYNLLKDENKKYNLTAITEEEQVYLKHFYDSISIAKIINIDNESICDIGTGAGFPGIVLKIFFPNIKLTLIESNNKKCNFLKMVSEKLNLNNIEIINERAEIYSKDNREIYDIVTSRAVAPLKHLLEYSVPLVKVDGYYIAMKSNINNEIENIDNYYNKLNIKEVDKIEFKLPVENSIRTLIKYKKIKETNKIYPRKYTDIKKKDI